MKIVLTLAAGLLGGYVLHSKKDQSIDSIANGVVDFLVRNRKSVADRFSK